MDIRDIEEDKQELRKQDETNITFQKISTKRNDKVILFNPPEIDFSPINMNATGSIDNEASSSVLENKPQIVPAAVYRIIERMITATNAHILAGS